MQQTQSPQQPRAVDSKAAPTIAMVQDGSRLHYAIPIAFQEQGLLERMFSTWYAPPRSLPRAIARSVRLMKPDLGTRMLERYSPHLDRGRIFTNPRLEWSLRSGRKKYASDREYWHWASAREAAWIRRKGFGDARALFGFIRNIDPDLCAYAHSRGLMTIGDQIIAPYAVEAAEEAIQRQRFGDWAIASPDPAEAEWETFEQRTWQHLDHFTCASDYVRTGLIGNGIPAHRISVIPYPVDTTEFPFVDRRDRQGPPTIGFVGAVSLRKGAPYFLELARRFDPAHARFVMVGAIHINANALAAHVGNVQMAGSVRRSQIPALLASFDVLYFPTTCEGSAGALIEAMATGLPVVTSPNSGTVARHGQEGFLCPYDDLDAAELHLRDLIDNREARLATGAAARKRIESLSVAQYGESFAHVFRNLIRGAAVRPTADSSGPSTSGR
ncbi:MAG TPA: glycosyltransferase family 4 protein [Phycisphaerae bacterium]|nr:glycosyltransferase family 4 protein [Phycisphaerae bacterium]